MDDLEPVRILIVDDRADKRLALQTLLEEVDAETDLAPSGEHALRLLLKRDYAVILLDVHMPTMDGFETASLIRERPRTEHTPIIFVTAVSATETHVSRGYELGAVDYIFQPVVPDVLRAKVSAFIDLFRKGREIQRKEQWLRTEAERRAAQAETRLHTLLNRLAVGVFRSALDGRILEANPAFLRLVGASDLEDLAQVDLDWFLEGLGGVPTSPIELNDREHFCRRQVEVWRGDGTRFWADLSRRVIVDPGGAVYIDGLLSDVTGRKQAEAALVEQAEALARSNADLERFAYLASHDLQEPLRMIAMYSQLLERRYGDQLDQDARDYLGYAAEGARRMQAMVRDLLGFSQLRAHQEDPEAVACEELLHRALFNLQIAIEESGADITHDPLPVLHADGDLLAHVFQNLLGNAIKFRGEACPQVHVGVEAIEGGWEFSVTDNGIGIDSEQKEAIFDVFRRLHGHDRYEGTGIGLAVCRNVVERHGGQIWVESERGRGTTFRFTIREGASGTPVRLEETISALG